MLDERVAKAVDVLVEQANKPAAEDVEEQVIRDRIRVNQVGIIAKAVLSDLHDIAVAAAILANTFRDKSKD